MKKLFIILLSTLSAWAAVVYFTRPDLQSDKPVIYRVTDNNPARELQLRRFHEWLEENNHPEMELRLDTSNSSAEKKIIQGVSGVASDLIDLPSNQVEFFVRMGLLHPVTAVAKEMGFSPDETYPNVRDILMVDGEQYVFPANVSIPNYIVNVDTFRKFGMKPPPERWTFEEFETMGKEYVKRANEGLPRQVNFFANDLSRTASMRSLGGDVYNETLTRCILDGGAFAKILDLIYKWTYEIRILPSSSDIKSQSTESGFGGQTLQMFNNGNYGLVLSGRYAIVPLRQFGDINLDVSEMPNGGYPNAEASSRTVGIYTGSKHKELAEYFLKFLASEAYSDLIVADGDALPPNPRVTRSQEFSQPKNFPNEYQFHEPFARYAESLAIPKSSSPFILPQTSERIQQESYDAFMAKLMDAQDAAEKATRRINDEIERNIEERPELRSEYERRLELQEKIEVRKISGQPIPIEWIYNPFFKRYYEEKGMLTKNTDV